MKPYFVLRERDREFYREHIEPRLPGRIFDAHVHVNLPEHIAMVPPARWLSDWALETGHLLPVPDAYACALELFPGADYSINAFPWPIREADLESNNAYLSREQAKGKISALMCVKPGWDPEAVERDLLEGKFRGFKPYPDMVSGTKGADMSIFDFIPTWQWAILERHRRAVMLHIPRKGRFADSDNIRELREIRQSYPSVTIIIAHFGRSFCPSYLREGLAKLGSAEGFYFDTSAVSNPEVYDVALSRLDPARILFGTDMPITFFRGKQEWTECEYAILTSDPFTWNRVRKPPEVETMYTIYIYEVVRAILDALERNGLGEKEREGIFRGNALRALDVDAPGPRALGMDTLGQGGRQA
jgi:predicted TIM-barrel fold metal-dependent hydrolase